MASGRGNESDNTEGFIVPLLMKKDTYLTTVAPLCELPLERIPRLEANLAAAVDGGNEIERNYSTVMISQGQHVSTIYQGLSQGCPCC